MAAGCSEMTDAIVCLPGGGAQAHGALLCSTEVGGSGDCPGKDKLAWRVNREEWRTSEHVSVISSPWTCPPPRSLPSPPAALELCQWGRCATDTHT